MTDNNLDLDNKLDDDKKKDDDVKTYSKEELEKLLQAETDRKVSKALETAKAKWELDFQEKLENEKNEAQKLAKLSEQERLKLEFDKKFEAFESERKQFMKEKLLLQTEKELSSIGLPSEFGKWIVTDNAEEIKANIDTFKEHFEKALEKAVNDKLTEKLSGTTPKTSTTKDTTTVTKEQFRKMNYSQRVALKNSNPDLYAQLQGS